MAKKKQRKGRVGSEEGKVRDASPGEGASSDPPGANSGSPTEREETHSPSSTGVATETIANVTSRRNTQRRTANDAAGDDLEPSYDGTVMASAASFPNVGRGAVQDPHGGQLGSLDEASALMRAQQSLLSEREMAASRESGSASARSLSTAEGGVASGQSPGSDQPADVLRDPTARGRMMAQQQLNDPRLLAALSSSSIGSNPYLQPPMTSWYGSSSVPDGADYQAALFRATSGAPFLRDSIGAGYPQSVPHYGGGQAPSMGGGQLSDLQSLRREAIQSPSLGQGSFPQYGSMRSRASAPSQLLDMSSSSRQATRKRAPRTGTSSSTPQEMTGVTRGILEPFPERLHRLLIEVEAAGHSDIISFTEDGHAFKIHKPEEFFKRIVQVYFKQTRLSSFKRQLNLYGFELIDHGPSKGGYYHDLFVRDDPDLARQIRRIDNKYAMIDRKKKEGRNSSSSFPDFYSMPPILSNEEAKRRLAERKRSGKTDGKIEQRSSAIGDVSTKQSGGKGKKRKGGHNDDDDDNNKEEQDAKAPAKTS